MELNIMSDSLFYGRLQFSLNNITQQVIWFLVKLIKASGVSVRVKT